MAGVCCGSRYAVGDWPVVGLTVNGRVAMETMCRPILPTSRSFMVLRSDSVEVKPLLMTNFIIYKAKRVLPDRVDKTV